MIKFILFIKKIYVLLLFIMLEALCLHYYASSTSYTRARLLTVSNNVAGGIHEGLSAVNNFIHLGGENRALTEEIAAMRNKLALYEDDTLAYNHAISGEMAAYHYMTARVVGNSTTSQHNFLMVNRGLRDEVDTDMAVISPEGGIVGYVLACSEKFASCISVLNTDFRTSGRVKNAEYVGSVYWDGLSAEHIMLSDIPKYAELQKGDTIVTSDYSSIFPPGMLIGTVESWTLNDQTYCYDVRVRLIPRISSVREVLLIRYNDAGERAALENSVRN